MNRKITTLISSLALSALFVTSFAINSNAVESCKKVKATSDITRSCNNQQKACKSSNRDQIEALVKSLTGSSSANPTNKKTCSTGGCDKSTAIKAAGSKAACNKTICKSESKATCNTKKCKVMCSTGEGSKIVNNKTTSPAKAVGKAPTKVTLPKAPATKATATKTAPKKTAATMGDYSVFQKKVVELVNKERAKAGLKPLKMNTELNKVATLKSQDMARNNYFDHTSPTYGSPFEMMRKFDIKYRTAGENIAMGQTTPEQVMNGWMNSPGHRANILKASFTEIGVGVAKNSTGRLYWTQQFIG